MVSNHKLHARLRTCFTCFQAPRVWSGAQSCLAATVRYSHVPEDGDPIPRCAKKSGGAAKWNLNPSHLRQSTALSFQRICNPTSWTPSRLRSSVTAGKVPIEMPRSIVIQDLTHLAVATDAADPDLVNNDIFHAALSCSGLGAKARLWWANRLF